MLARISILFWIGLVRCWCAYELTGVKVLIREGWVSRTVVWAGLVVVWGVLGCLGVLTQLFHLYVSISW